MKLKNQKVAVIGLGKSGFAAAKFLKSHGARVWASEGSNRPEVLRNARRLKKLGVTVETGAHTERFLEKADLFVTSPGVSKQSLPLSFALKKKIPVISEIELAYPFCPGTVIGITGSNGKTTTSHLIHELLRRSGKPSVLCGNVGFAFLDALPKILKKTFVVLELSSFQLEDSPGFRPKIAVFLNLNPNHLDRHKTLRAYAQAKANIFKCQRASDFLIANFDDAKVRSLARKARSRVLFFSKRPLKSGVYLSKGRVHARWQSRKSVLIRHADFHLKGAHNLENILAAAAAAFLLKIPAKKIERTLRSFRTLEHRIEPLGEIGGVRFFNDSKSTTVESTRAALLAVPKPVVLIAGGRDKGADFKGIERVLEDRVSAAVFYGEARQKLARSFGRFRRFETVDAFDRAVRLAFRRARAGENVLLSPMCTSFDQFRSFEHRGQVFKKLVREIRGKLKKS